MTHYQFGFGYGTASQIAAYAGIAYEPVVDTTNSRLVIMLGTGPGNNIPIATQAYVDTSIGALTLGQASNFAAWLNNT